MKMFKKMKKGFTLVELIIVMVILGALAAIAIPKMGGSTDGAILASMKSDARMAVAKANEQYSKDLVYTNVGGLTSGTAVTGLVSSPGNTITVTAVGTTDFTAVITRSAAPCAASTYTYTSSNGSFASNDTTDTTKLTCK